MTYQSARAITLTPITANLINQRRFVSLLATGVIDETTAAGDAVGVSLDESDANDSVPIPVAVLDGGVVEVEAGAAVTQGARVMSDATGRAIDATGATARVLGFALDSSTGAGEVIRVIGSKAAGEFVT